MKKEFNDHQLAAGRLAIYDGIIDLAVQLKISVEDAFTLYNKARMQIKKSDVLEFDHESCDCEKGYLECPYQEEDDEKK